eukprot:scaffold297552_cov30-Tisochrysis_lutea.AAC.1
MEEGLKRGTVRLVCAERQPHPFWRAGGAASEDDHAAVLVVRGHRAQLRLLQWRRPLDRRRGVDDKEVRQLRLERGHTLVWRALIDEDEPGTREPRLVEHPLRRVRLPIHCRGHRAHYGRRQTEDETVGLKEGGGTAGVAPEVRAREAARRQPLVRPHAVVDHKRTESLAANEGAPIARHPRRESVPPLSILVKMRR